MGQPEASRAGGRAALGRVSKAGHVGGVVRPPAVGELSCGRERGGRVLEGRCSPEGAGEERWTFAGLGERTAQRRRRPPRRPLSGQICPPARRQSRGQSSKEESH